MWDERFAFDCVDPETTITLTLEDEDQFILGRVKNYDFLGNVELKDGDLGRAGGRRWSTPRGVFFFIAPPRRRR